MNDQIFQYLKNAFWILFGSGIVFEITPFIKINPISAILEWIGNKLNKDLKKEISQIDIQVKTLQTDLQDHKIESQRRNILDFSDELMRGKRKTKENFNNIIQLHDKYNTYIETNDLENGQVDLAFDYISKKYRECLDNNNFL
jgi:hypothetical protein